MSFDRSTGRFYSTTGINYLQETIGKIRGINIGVRYEIPNFENARELITTEVEFLQDILKNREIELHKRARIYDKITQLSKLYHAVFEETPLKAYKEHLEAGIIKQSRGYIPWFTTETVTDEEVENFKAYFDEMDVTEIIKMDEEGANLDKKRVKAKIKMVGTDDAHPGIVQQVENQFKALLDDFKPGGELEDALEELRDLEKEAPLDGREQEFVKALETGLLKIIVYQFYKLDQTNIPLIQWAMRKASLHYNPKINHDELAKNFLNQIKKSDQFTVEDKNRLIRSVMSYFYQLPKNEAFNLSNIQYLIKLHSEKGFDLSEVNEENFNFFYEIGLFNEESISKNKKSLTLAIYNLLEKVIRNRVRFNEDELEARKALLVKLANLINRFDPHKENIDNRSEFARAYLELIGDISAPLMGFLSSDIKKNMDLLDEMGFLTPETLSPIMMLSRNFVSKELKTLNEKINTLSHEEFSEFKKMSFKLIELVIGSENRIFLRDIEHIHPSLRDDYTRLLEKLMKKNMLNYRILYTAPELGDQALFSLFPEELKVIFREMTAYKMLSLRFSLYGTIPFGQPPGCEKFPRQIESIEGYRDRSTAFFHQLMSESIEAFNKGYSEFDFSSIAHDLKISEDNLHDPAFHKSRYDAFKTVTIGVIEPGHKTGVIYKKLNEEYGICIYCNKGAKEYGKEPGLSIFLKKNNRITSNHFAKYFSKGAESTLEYEAVMDHLQPNTILTHLMTKWQKTGNCPWASEKLMLRALILLELLGSGEEIPSKDLLEKKFEEVNRIFFKWRDFDLQHAYDDIAGNIDQEIFEMKEEVLKDILIKYLQKIEDEKDPENIPEKHQVYHEIARDLMPRLKDRKNKHV